ncbi:hypothetical protein SCHPADRAFT_879793 [Schizopora paradoxa]|uniref:Uncharacterized protein n=1 Tax=Schizopora paradoxa TaxID=27342 RepID=A0A0H2RWB2_9AGAM|nr:hypothetical protein SCHPADRAFT_879793 [Schizopora paradoxa]
MPRRGAGEPPIAEPIPFHLPGNDGIDILTRYDPANGGQHFFDCHLCGASVKLAKSAIHENILRHWESRINGKCALKQRKNAEDERTAAREAHARYMLHGGQPPVAAHENPLPSPSISANQHRTDASFAPHLLSPVPTAPASSARAYYHPDANASNSSVSDGGLGDDLNIHHSSSKSSLRVSSTSSTAAARVYHPYQVSGDPGPQAVLHHRLARAARLSTSSLESYASSTDSVNNVPVVRDDGCPGAWVDWTPGSIWSTYPFQRHEHEDLGWELIGYDKKSDPHRLLLRSVECVMENGGSSGLTCSKCHHIPYSAGFNVFRQRAIHAKENTNWRFLNSVQQSVLLQSYQTEARKLRTQVKNLSRKAIASARRMNDYQRIVMLLSQKDVAGLRRILASALDRGISPQKLLNLLERAVSGAYRVRGGYSQRDLDVSFLVRAIGGPRLLFALNKSHGLVSVQTIDRNFKVPQLVPSKAVPTVEEIHSNIKAFFSEEVKKPPPVPKLGNTLMFDGIALETKCRYCHTRDVILGVCREHAHRVNLSVDDWESVEKVRMALFQETLPEGERDDEKRICFGKEATVVAVGSLGRSDHYVPVPIVVSPSCKSEKGHELAEWIRVVLLAWKTHPMGESKQGPIWSLASDGDSAFRLARSLICTEKEFDPFSRTIAGKKLNSLSGLNRMTSKDGIVGSCDPKHIEKRFATLLRNESGIMVGDQHINAEIVLSHLCSVEGMTRESARELLNPIDKQNVPKAVRLIQTLASLKRIPPDECTTPGLDKERNTLIFLGKFLNSFVSPFTTANFSLSEQVTNLVAYAHVALVLYKRHQTGCMTGALYADSQAAIKSIIFTIARMQEVEAQLCGDPAFRSALPLKFFLGHEGTDRLEVIFGEARTHDHARNFDILQLCQKLASSVLVSSTFERNPDIDPGHKRLKLKDMEGVDHTNPFSWEGDTEVGHVDLLKTWQAGRDLASTMLFDWDGTIFDFDSWFAQDGVDLSRPLGKYVGVDLGKDDMRTELENIDPLLYPPAPPDPGFDMDDWLPDRVQALQEPTQESPELTKSPLLASNSNTTSSPFSRVLVREGKKYLKSSVVASLSPKNSKKLSIRPLRVRGWSLENLVKREVVDDSILDDKDLIKRGDVAAVLCRASDSKQLALGAMRISGFQDADGHAVSSVPATALQGPNSKIKVAGQVMELVLDRNNIWKWNGQYIRIKKETTTQSAVNVKNSTLTNVQGSFVHALGPDIVPFDKSLTASKNQILFSLYSDLIYSEGSGVPLSTTWQFDGKQLEEVKEIAWQQVSGQHTNHHQFTEELLQNIKCLPLIEDSQSFPYIGRADREAFIVPNAPAWIWGSVKEKRKANDLIPCLLCDNQIQFRDMRAHVGGHILLASRETTDTSLKPGCTISADPCGWCGQDPVVSKCTTQLIRTKEEDGTITSKVKSNCIYAYSRMSYNGSRVLTKANKCTNIPIHCLMCPLTQSGHPRSVWKYNAVFHVAAEHEDESGSLEDIPVDFLFDMHVKRSEELALGVCDESITQFRDTYNVPASDVIQEMRETRTRSGTVIRAPGAVTQEPPSQAAPKTSSKRRKKKSGA